MQVGCLHHVREYEIAGVRDEAGAKRKKGHMTNGGAHPQPHPSTISSNDTLTYAAPADSVVVMIDSAQHGCRPRAPLLPLDFENLGTCPSLGLGQKCRR